MLSVFVGIFEILKKERNVSKKERNVIKKERSMKLGDLLFPSVEEDIKRK